MVRITISSPTSPDSLMVRYNFQSADDVQDIIDNVSDYVDDIFPGVEPENREIATNSILRGLNETLLLFESGEYPKEIIISDTDSSADGNTIGVITAQARAAAVPAQQANPAVTAETAAEQYRLIDPTITLLSAEDAERVRQWAEERKEELTAWATQTGNEISAALDSPFEGISGAIKDTWNIVPDVLDLAYAGAQIIEITASTLGAKIAGLFSDKWAKKAEEYADNVKSQLGYSAFNFLRFENLSEAEKGGACLAMINPFVLLKTTGRKLEKEIAEEAAEIIRKKPSAGGVVKPREIPPDKTPDTPAAKVSEDTKKTQSGSDGKGTDNNNRNVGGDPVDLVSGDFIQSWPVIRIPGLLPVELTRTYYSVQSARGLFGEKWADDWSMYLEIHGDTADFQDPGGNRYTFEISGDEVRSRNLRAPYYLLSGNRKTGLQIQDNRRQRVYHFEPAPVLHRRLIKITNLQGVALHFHYNEDRQLSHLSRDDGFIIRLHYQQHQLTHIDYSCDNRTQRLVSCRYDNSGYLSECDAFQQNHLWHSYTSEGWMTGWQDSDQTSLTVTYDDRGRVIQTYSDSGYWCDRFVYDDTLRLNTYIDGEGGHFRYYYNEDNLVVRTLDPSGRETRTEWRDFQKISETNDIGEITRYVYHADGLPAQIYLPDNRKIGCEYNDNGQLTRYIAPTGDEWRLNYDTAGNLISETDPQGRVQMYEYSVHGELLKVVSPDGAQWRYEYTSAHQLSRSINPYLNSTEYQFDELGRLTHLTDALNNTTRYHYDPSHAGVNGSISDIFLPDGVHQHIDYDSERRVVAVTDGEGKITRYRYGPFDLLLAMVRPDGTEIRFEYDSLTRLKKVINAAGDEYRYERDKAGQIIRETDFTGREIQYRYDRLGRRTATRYPDQHEIRWSYSPEGLIIRQDIWFDDGTRSELKSATHYEYNARMQLIRAENPDAVTEFEYDAAGRLICEKINGREIQHEWDEQTDRLMQTRFGSQALQYQYGLQGELTQFQAGEHQPLRLSRNALGQEYLRHSQSGFASSRHYTATGMLAHQTAGRGSDSYLQALRDNPVQPPAASDVNRSWQYDKAYNITAIDDHRWRRMQYRYNQNDQIEHTSFGGLYPQTEQFSYDTNLNIRQQTLIPGEAQGALHQLSQQQQAGRVVRRTTATGHFDYHYDINGRLERKTEHRNGFRPREWRYQWDTLNQLTSCFTPQGDCWRYTYDAFGRRLSKYQVVNAQEPVHLQHLNQQPVVRGRQYLWSGNQMIEEAPVYADGTVAYDAGVQWLYEPGALVPAARYEKGKLHYLVTDHQGTPREIFTETGTVSWAARPDTWGQMAFWSLKTSANDPNYTECHFRFAGQYEDAETGLYYNRFRYYDKDTGQYITPDPIGLEGGFNPYGYVHCPVGWVDPFGLSGTSKLNNKWIPKDVQGRKVYQRDDLFDPNFVDADGLTNIQRMKNGSAPIGRDGLEINLHHLTQDEPGAMAEVLSSFHAKNNRALHIYTNGWDKTWVGADGVRRTYNGAPPSMNRTPFNAWKREYWKTRALDF